MVPTSYPGVYIQELPSGVRTIVGVATSIGAFVDFFATGPMDRAVRVLSFPDFERQFGGLDTRSEASYALQQFFLNGGTQAHVVRVSSTTAGKGAKAAGIGLSDAPTTTNNWVLSAQAASPGAWGNQLRVDVDYGTTNPATQFNLTVTALSADGQSVTATESYRNLVIGAGQANDAASVVNNASALVSLTAASGSDGKRPMATGSACQSFAPDLVALGLKKEDVITAGLNNASAKDSAVPLADTDANVPTTAAALAQRVQAMLRTIAGLGSATVSVGGSTSTTQYLVVKAGTPNAADYVAITDSSGLGQKLKFDKALQNVQQYALGAASGAQAQALVGGAQQAGGDGQLDAAGFAAGLIGDAAAKTGLQALQDVDLFNILCIPATMNLPDTQTDAVASAAIALCESRRAMYLLDAPQADKSRDTVPEIMSWLDQNASLRSRNAALYFPRVDIPDPKAGFLPRKVAPSGTVAGLWARTDSARGVWKAPAGTEATLAGVQKLEYRLTDPENGVLNPLAINCLRTFPIYGPVCWGARTLFGADQMADDYKYIPIRRLALFIEESLYRGTQWVVFEPNDVPLWTQIRLNVGAFMQTLYRQGAFQGTTPQQAYYVQCDATNNPQATINLGIVNIQVGFAPLKPAEFVVITIQQIAGQLAS